MSEKLLIHSEKLNTQALKCFIGGLHPLISEDEIKERFSKFGDIQNINLPFDKKKLKNRGFSIICFKEKSAARRALQSNGKVQIRGIKVNIRKYLNPKIASKMSKNHQSRKLFAIGFPEQASQLEIEGLFQKYGNLEKVTMQHSFCNGKKVFKGFAFVVMRDEQSLINLLSQNSVSFNGNLIKVEKAKPKQHSSEEEFKQTKDLNNSCEYYNEPRNYWQEERNLRFNLIDKDLSDLGQNNIFSNEKNILMDINIYRYSQRSPLLQKHYSVYGVLLFKNFGFERICLASNQSNKNRLFRELEVCPKYQCLNN